MAVLSTVVLVGSLTACGGSDTTTGTGTTTGTNETTSDESNSTSTDGSVLNVHIGVEVASMDPQIATDGTSFEVLAAVTEGLYALDADGNAILGVAESVEKAEDGLSYVFKLRDTTWSNGTKVTANDFVFAWRRVVDPAVASEYAFIMSVAGVKNAEAISAGEMDVTQLGVTAVDETTLKVELDFPVAFFESLMTFPTFLPVNEEFFTASGDTYATSPATILCNGAFTVTSYEPAATTITLTKNANYWDAANVQLAGIKYQVIKESQQAMLAYTNGDLDVVSLSGEQVEQYQNDPEFTNVMAGYLWYISPNQTVAGLENENLRKALALSYDKEAVAKNILKDGSIAANFAVPSELATGPDGKDFRETADTYLTTDKAQALAYWETAKTELGVSELTYTMLVEDTESAQNVAQFIQAEIQTTLPGIIIELEVLPKKNRVERLQDGDFQLCLTRWGPDYADPMTYLEMWVTGSANNYGFWSNTEYDAIIEDATKGQLALDQTARWEALKEAEKIVMEEAVILPVYQKGDAVMIKSNVSGIEFHSVGINRVFTRTVKE